MFYRLQDRIKGARPCWRNIIEWNGEFRKDLAQTFGLAEPLCQLHTGGCAIPKPASSQATLVDDGSLLPVKIEKLPRPSSSPIQCYNASPPLAAATTPPAHFDSSARAHRNRLPVSLRGFSNLSNEACLSHSPNPLLTDCKRAHSPTV